MSRLNYCPGLTGEGAEATLTVPCYSGTLGVMRRGSDEIAEITAWKAAVNRLVAAPLAHLLSSRA